MKKTYLLKYEPSTFGILADYSLYYLFTETLWFYGLFKTKNKSEYRIYEHQCLRTFFDHWDNLIKSKKALQ